MPEFHFDARGNPTTVPPMTEDILDVLPENIPQRLKDIHRWLIWKAVPKANGSGYTKPPYQARLPHLPASTKNPQHWATFDEALAAYRANSDVAGIGFVLHKGEQLLGGDFDHCVNQGEIADWVDDVIIECGTYAEISPSGHGVRIIGEGEINRDFNNRQQGVELYGGNGWRYLTITGHVINDHNEIRDCEQQFHQYAARWDIGQSSTTKSNGELPPAPATPPDLSRIDPFLRQLLAGDYAAYHGDRSAALQGACADLLKAGYTDGEVLYILTDPEHAISDVALSRRGADRRSAAEWIYKYQFPSAQDKADKFRQQEGITIEIQPDGTKKQTKDYGIIWLPDIQPNLNETSLIRGTIAPESMIVTYGESNSGKTFHVLDRDLTLAMGRTWYDRETTGGFVIYVAAEGAHSVTRRIAAYRDRMIDSPKDVPFAVIPQSINLLDPKADVPFLVDYIKAIEDKRGAGCIKITVDTLARAISGGNENSSEDMGAVVMNADRIRQSLGCAIEFVHHSGKDTAKGARGHSSLRAATDTEIEVKVQDKLHIAKITKQRDFDIGEEFPYTLDVVQLGFDAYGHPITTCVPVWKNPVDVPEKEKRILTRGEKLLFDLYFEALKEYGQMPNPQVIHRVTGRTKVIGREDLREYVRKSGGITESDKPDTELKAFKRALVGLKNKGKLDVYEDWIWQPDKAGQGRT